MTRPFDWEPSEAAYPPRGGDPWSAYIYHFVAHDVNHGVFWYLVCAHAYYVDNCSLMCDANYDYLARILRKYWTELEDTELKRLLTPEDLDCATYNELESGYPDLVIKTSKTCQRTRNGRKGELYYEHRHYDPSEL